MISVLNPYYRMQDPTFFDPNRVADLFFPADFAVLIHRDLRWRNGSAAQQDAALYHSLSWKILSRFDALSPLSCVSQVHDSNDRHGGEKNCLKQVKTYNHSPQSGRCGGERNVVSVCPELTCAPDGQMNYRKNDDQNLPGKDRHKNQAASARIQNSPSMRNACRGGNHRLIHESGCCFQALSIFPVATWIRSMIAA